jgi:hypothetical protein
MNFLYYFIKFDFCVIFRFHSHLPHIRTPFNHKEFNLINRDNVSNMHNSTYTLITSLNGTTPNETQPQQQQNSQNSTSNNLLEPNKSLHNSFSCHELNLKHNQQNGAMNQVQSGFHFHLAGFIDPEAGIPLHLLSNMKSSKDANFVVHWINNKDFHFTYAAELFSREIFEKIRKVQSEKMMMLKKNQSEMGSNEENLSETLNGKYSKKN